MVEIEYCGRLSTAFGARARVALPDGVGTVALLSIAAGEAVTLVLIGDGAPVLVVDDGGA